MNCRHFQDHLYEYVEGSLPALAQAGAGKHLAECLACRQAVQQEQQLVQFFSDRLQQASETLALRPQIRQRILANLDRNPNGPANNEFMLLSWIRFARPLAVAASVLLIVALLLVSRFSRKQPQQVFSSDRHAVPTTVSIQLSYCVPTYVFRQEGNLVVDTLACETVVASEMLLTSDQKSEKRMLL